MLTVLELFKKADPELVYYAYIVCLPVFEDYDNHRLIEKAKALSGLKEKIIEICDYISSCDIEEDKDYTIFISYRNSMEYDKSYIKEIFAFCIEDNEAINVIDKEFTIWNNDGEVVLKHYGFDFSKYEEVAGYYVAEESISREGIEACCAVILQEMCRFGFDPEYRNSKINEMITELKETIKHKDEQKYYTFEEVFGKLEEDFLNNASDDEREHHRLEKLYKESVKDIEHRAYIKLINENHSVIVEQIRNEYTNRHII